MDIKFIWLIGIVAVVFVIIFIVKTNAQTNKDIAGLTAYTKTLDAQTAAKESKTKFKDVLGPIASIFQSGANIYGSYQSGKA